MRLTIVRHAESVANVEKRHSGHTDHELSETGKRQAELIGQRLESESFDHIYVSDLTRTRQTAEPIIARHPNTPITYDSRLREKHLGILEGRLRSEIDADKWGTVEGGESQEALTKRIIAFLDEIREKHDEHILIISHGGYITTLLMHLAGSDDKETYHPGNASVSIVEFDVEGPTITLVGDQRHL